MPEQGKKGVFGSWPAPEPGGRHVLAKSAHLDRADQCMGDGTGTRPPHFLAPPSLLPPGPARLGEGRVFGGPLVPGPWVCQPLFARDHPATDECAWRSLCFVHPPAALEVYNASQQHTPPTPLLPYPSRCLQH